jgi:Mn2+/Fe2+ NRAMP family transporter
LKKKLSRTVQAFLPGIFLLGFNIGTGSVTAMAKAGADYGMSLLWTILVSCFVTYFMIVIYGKYTLVTGETALYSFRKHIHPAVGIFFIIALTIAVCGSIIGVMGIIADVCTEWSKTFIEGGISPVWFAAFFIALVYIIFLNGQTHFFQRALAVIVAVMAVSFLINFFILMPRPTEIVRGLVPSVPHAAAGDKRPLLVIASMVGTTVASCIFIVRTTLVKEAGWKVADLKIQKRDAGVSALLMFVISGAIMASAAGTLHAGSLGLSRASQMIELLEPLAGRFAVAIFVSGIVAAGISSQFPNVLLLPWLLCDYRQSERNLRRTDYRIIVACLSLLGLLVPVFKAQPVIIMIASQAFGALILPMTVLAILYLSSRKKIMGDYVNRRSVNVILGVIFLFSLYISGSSIIGLLDVLAKS